MARIFITGGTGCIGAATIHKLLGFNPMAGGFEKDQDDPIDADVFIVVSNVNHSCNAVWKQPVIRMDELYVAAILIDRLQGAVPVLDDSNVVLAPNDIDPAVGSGGFLRDLE